MSTYLREGLQKRGVREKQFFHEFLGRTAVVGERSIPFIGRVWNRWGIDRHIGLP